MAIKHELELEGKTYPYSHDIGELIELSSDLAEFEEYEKLYLTASKISEFESHTRYDKNYLASAKMVSILGPIAEKLLKTKSRPEGRLFSLYEADDASEVFTGGGSTRQRLPYGIRDNACENRKGEA